MNYRSGKKEEADKSIFSQLSTPKQSFSGFTPNLLIGSFGYPFVTIGALTSEDKSAKDNPEELTNTPIADIISQRQSFIHSKLSMHTKQLNNKFVEQLQDIAKSSIRLDSDVELVKPLAQTTTFHQKAMPHGPSALVKTFDLTSNAKVKRKVERLTSDTDVKAKTAIDELKTLGEHQLTKLLSAGTLGQQRKLVPTKWSITAVDDLLSQPLRQETMQEDYHHEALFMSNHLGNHFYILLLPGQFCFELLEIVQPHTIHNSSKYVHLSHDYEYPEGRKRYVEETAGAYYAARLAILEYLRKQQKQARVIILRFITEEYTAPLGVWVIREGIRQALAEEKEVKEYKATLQNIIKSYNVEPSIILKKLQLLNEEQQSLRKYVFFPESNN